MNRSPFTTAPENEAVITQLQARLAKLPAGAAISYAQLENVCGQDLRRRRYLLSAAIARSERELGCIFACVRGIGVKRLPIQESGEIAATRLRSVRKGCQRTAAKLDRVKTNDETVQKRHIALSALLRTLGAQAGNAAARAAKPGIDPDEFAKPLPKPAILAALKKVRT